MPTSKDFPKQKKCTDHQEVDTASQNLLDYNLSLTTEERLLQHQSALDTINELIKARKQIYGELESSTETSS